jgi:hypothetical protein
MNNFFIDKSSFFFVTTILNLALVVHLWFNTDFFAYYLQLFKKIIPGSVFQFLLIEEYFAHDHSTISFRSYIDFFFFKKSASRNFVVLFFLKILSCKICLTVWVSILVSLVFMNINLIGLSYLLLRFFDFILEKITFQFNTK